MRILLVEDDVVAARSMELTLRAAGAVVEHAENANEALDLAKFYDFDVIVLDIEMPGTDGYEALRRMRAERISAPILIVSGLTQSRFKVKALVAGADDFVAKPIDKPELVARVRALVRRSRGLAQSLISIESVTINIENKEVLNNNTPIHLTSKEYSILELLILRRGMILTKEMFLNHLYGGLDEPEIKIIDVFICKLRKKLRLNHSSLLIETVWGRGYMIKNSPNVETSKINFQYFSSDNSRSSAIHVTEIPQSVNIDRLAHTTAWDRIQQA